MENKKIIITLEQLESIVRQLISVPCSPTLKLWNLAYDALCLANNSKVFITLVNEMAAEGKVR